MECYIRRFPMVGLKAAKVLQEVEKRELATDNRLPVRNVRKLVLKSPYYPTLQDLTLIRPFRFLAPSAFPESGNTAEGIRKPVGTGPWVLAESKLAEYDVFVRNEHYWGPKPKIERIVVKVIPDPHGRAIAFETGLIDLIFGPGGQIGVETFKRFADSGKYQTRVSKPLATRALAVNSNRGPTRNSPFARRSSTRSTKRP